MLPRYRIVCRSFAVGVLLALVCSNASAQEDDFDGREGRGTYVGIFGGGGASNVNNVSQVGTVLSADIAGGPLAVNALGSASSNRGVGIVGLQIGREGSGFEVGQGNGWRLLPATELEAYYMGGTEIANLRNSTPRIPGHAFVDTFPMNNAVFLTNAVFSLQTPGRLLAPYFGAGIGAASVNIDGADSAQVVPAEAGVNHFNSGTDSSCWGFAAQTKAGLRINLTDRVWIFSEYRFLYISGTSYTFGSTQYPTHTPTTPWTVNFGDMSNHMAVGGIGFSF